MKTDCPTPPRSDSYAVRLACWGLALAVVLVFGQTVGHNFINCDDFSYVVQNNNVNSGFSWENVCWAFTTIHSSNWHPLTWLSHTLDVQCYGLWAGGHHLTNILLHAVSAILLFLTLRRMTAAFWCSLIVAAMFAIHPLRVESVAWVAERKDVLSGLFWMLTLCLYVWYAEHPAANRRVAIVAVFALGLMAKSMLVTLPAVLLLLDFWPLGRWRPKGFSPELPCKATEIAPSSLKQLLLEKIPLVVLAVLVSCVVAAGQKSAGTMLSVGALATDVRLENAAVSYIAYLGKMIWPVDLAILYPHPAVIHPEAAGSLLWQGILAAIGLLAITVGVLCCLRRRPYLAVGWFWYLGTLLPVIGIVQIGNHAMADRYTYLPMIGIFIMIVWGAADLASQSHHLRVAFGTAAAVVLGVWMAVAARQVSYWRDTYTVFGHAIAVTERNYFAHNMLGMAYDYNGQAERAQAEYEKAVGIAPNYVSVNVNLGNYWMKHGQYRKAETYLQSAAAVNPFGGAHYTVLNELNVRQKLLNDAVAKLRRSVAQHPDDARDCMELAELLANHGETEKAVVELRRFLVRHPDNAAIRGKLERIFDSTQESSSRSE
jgi:protein O-mannosyl-transferase